MEKQDIFDENEIGDLKSEIAHFIVPRLKFFITFYEEAKSIHIPTWVDESLNKKPQKEWTEKELINLNQKWIKILKHMLVPFEDLIEPLKYNHYSPQQLAVFRNEGLRLFAKYFDHLWY